MKSLILIWLAWERMQRLIYPRIKAFLYITRLRGLNPVKIILLGMLE
ncbi:hypothetical protein CF161_16601 [Pseudomonas sp. CF161]|nr:hypothetical protein CF161_16601 [Pseudomonas sp. CF161]